MSRWIPKISKVGKQVKVLRKIFFFHLSFVFLIAGVTGCEFFHTPDTHQEVPVEEFGKSYAVEELMTDIDFLVQTLEEVHPNLYDYTSRETFNKERQRIEKMITLPLTRIEFYFLIAPLVSMLKDGHTKIYPVYEEYYHHIREDGLIFPLDVKIMDSSTIVTANYSSDSVPAVGAELLSINGIETSKLIDTLLPVVSGERLEKRLEYLANFYPHFLYIMYPSENSFDLRFIPVGKKEIKEQSVSGVTYWDIQKQKQSQVEQENNYSYRILDDSSIGLLEITLFPGEGEKYNAFLEEVFKDLQKKRTTHLIIDIRRNGGGYSPAAIELLRYLTDKPIARIPRMDIKVSEQIKEYYRLSLPKYLRWFPMQWIHPTWRKIWNAAEGTHVTVASDPEVLEDTPFQFSGDVYVLIGPGTFSTATEFSAMVKDYKLGELIGSETGGLATSYGAFYPFDLPNTRLLVRVSHKRIYRPSGEDDGHGVIPDHTVMTTRRDISLGVDPILGYAIELIKSRKKK
jgi:hypothetical protein